MCDTQGRDPRGPHGGHERVQGSASRSTTDGAHARRRDGGRRRVHRASPRPTCVTPEMVAAMAPTPDHLRAGEPRSGDRLRRGRGRAPRRDRGDRALATIPNQVNNVLGFPFIFRGALDVRRAHDQRGDEARRRARAGGAGARGGARLACVRGVRRQALRVRAATTSSPSRSIRACCCGSRRPSRKAAMETGVARVSRSTSTSTASASSASRQRARDHAHDHQQGAARAAGASSSPRATEQRVLRAVPDPVEEEIAQPDPARQRAGDPRSRGGEPRHRHHRASRSSIRAVPTRATTTREALVQAARAQGRDRAGRGRLILRRSYFGADDGRIGRRRRHGRRPHRSLPGDSIRPALEVVGLRRGAQVAAGMYVVILQERVKLLRRRHGATSSPIRRAARRHRRARRRDRARFGIDPAWRCSRPRTSASVRDERTKRIARAVELVRERGPTLDDRRRDAGRHRARPGAPRHALRASPRSRARRTC